MPQKATPVKETPFAIEVERAGAAATVRLGGSCTMTVAAQVGETLSRLATEQIRYIVVDMTGLDFLESTGLGGIVAGYLRLRRSGGDLCLVAPQPSIRHLLDLTRLTQLFRVFDRTEDALKCCPPN